ncbi:MAG: CtsR family transcriptional regulator [Candidatus Ornithomonoglobus sp.]
MGMSDKIEAFLLELLKQDQEDQLRIQRNELAQLFGCVPSQINYVIATRFSPEKGYIVESRRGGGGYVTIRRAKQSSAAEYIGSSIGEKEAVDFIEMLYNAGKTDAQTASLMQAAVSAQTLKGQDSIRADILKSMLNVTK